MSPSKRPATTCEVDSRELADSSKTLWIDLEDSDERWREFLADVAAGIMDGEEAQPTSEGTMTSRGVGSRLRRTTTEGSHARPDLIDRQSDQASERRGGRAPTRTGDILLVRQVL